jgi:hypothetical protein
MRKGIPVAGEEFFELLIEDADFCRELGRAVLAAGRLETRLKQFLSAEGVAEDMKTATLGRLISIVTKQQILVKWLPTLNTLKIQRNYLVHNVHALFAGIVEETILPRTDLLDSDVDMYTDRATQLAENLSDVADAWERMAHEP